MEAQLKNTSHKARIGIVIVAVVAWFFGGVQISITNLALRSAGVGLMGEAGWIDEARYQALGLESRSGSLSEADQAQLIRWN